jgi:hypothetical protein
LKSKQYHSASAGVVEHEIFVRFLPTPGATAYEALPKQVFEHHCFIHPWHEKSLRAERSVVTLQEIPSMSPHHCNTCKKPSGQLLGLIVMSHDLARFEFKYGTFR